MGITITQIYWVRRAFDLKEAEFERTVNAALYTVAQQIFEINQTPSPAINPVKQVSTNYFAVMVNSDIDAGLLEFLLRNEFEKRNVRVDFEYGIYDCSHEKMVYGDYVAIQTTREKTTSKTLPKWANNGYYFGVQFPTREAHLLNQMGIWSFSSVVLLLVIVFFSYTIFVILKQKRLSEIQKDFINNMTHEFKTPIATIAVSAEVLKNPTIAQHPERLLNYAGIIEKENLRLQQHVERVLQMAQLDRSELTLKPETTNIHQLIKEAIQHHSQVVTEKNGTIKSVFEAPENTLLTIDVLHITNVLHNLLDNAIKYSDKSPIIVILTSIENKCFTIQVIDNGIGIRSEEHQRIFKKFYRVPTGNVHNVKGFGLGLSYVQTVMQAHHGSISVSSELGKGCAFSLRLPLT